MALEQGLTKACNYLTSNGGDNQGDFSNQTTSDDGAAGALQRKWSKRSRDLPEPVVTDRFLTPLDAKRIACLVEIFNSPEFAALTEQRAEAQPSGYKWKVIVAFVDFGCVVQDQGAPDVKDFLAQLRAVFKEP